MTKTKNTCKERISNLHENLVVGYNEGDCLGKVGEIYFDKKTCGIQGISLVAKHLEPGDKDFVKFKEIHKLGNSVVIVSSGSALEKTPKGLAKSSLRTLNGIKIVTEEGEYIGELSDVNLIEETGVVKDILIYGDRKIPVDVEKDNIHIGPDMIVIPSAYKANITALAPKEPEDNFESVFKSAGEATRKFADTLSAAVQRMAGISRPEAEENTQPAKKAESVGKASATTPKAAPEKPAAKEAAAEKPAAEKAAAEKPAAKEAAPEKPAAKKAAPAKKKAATKKAATTTKAATKKAAVKQATPAKGDAPDTKSAPIKKSVVVKREDS